MHQTGKISLEQVGLFFNKSSFSSWKGLFQKCLPFSWRGMQLDDATCLILALWHGSPCTLGYSVFVRGWAHRVDVQTNSSRNPLHQQAWNSHICDVFEQTQAPLFFLLPPSTTAPSALPLPPIPQLCATASSRRTLCTNTHSALLSLKSTSQTEKKRFFWYRMVAFWVYTMWRKKGLVSLLSYLFVTPLNIPPSSASMLS